MSGFLENLIIRGIPALALSGLGLLIVPPSGRFHIGPGPSISMNGGVIQPARQSLILSLRDANACPTTPHRWTEGDE